MQNTNYFNPFFYKKKKNTEQLADLVEYVLYSLVLYLDVTLPFFAIVVWTLFGL